MAKFTFKLDGVLAHRRRTEQQAQRVVAEKAAVVAEIEAKLRGLQGDVTAAADALRDGRLTGPLDLNYLTAHRRYAADAAQRGAGLVKQIAAAQKHVDDARRLLAEAAKQRKVLETLREQHHARWKAEQARRELAEADDAASRSSYADIRDADEDDEARRAFAHLDATRQENKTVEVSL